MRIVVQKYGGTSLSTIEGRALAVSKINGVRDEYDGVVVVVSAMGRLGEPYATDTLLSLVSGEDTKLSDKEIDMLISCGEIISASVIVNILKEKGLDAIALSGGEAGVITDCNYTKARVIEIDTKKIDKLLSEKKIVIVAGFQGRGTDNEITTIGRGGSDLSALLIGEALKAELVEIYTDVDGIMTADPSICEQAKIINYISYEDVFQMAGSGAKVIHQLAVEIARRSGMRIVIKNTFNDYAGTCITWYNQVNKKVKGNQLISSIAHRRKRIQFIVEGNIDDERFFRELASKFISIDIINIFPCRRVFTIDDYKKEDVLDVLKDFDADYSYVDHCAKITIIGERMTGVPGVMARIIKKLNEVNVEILQTADSLSTITCLIKEKALEKAVCALHEEFELNEEH